MKFEIEMVNSEWKGNITADCTTCSHEFHSCEAKEGIVIDFRNRGRDESIAGAAHLPPVRDTPTSIYTTCSHIERERSTLLARGKRLLFQNRYKLLAYIYKVVVGRIDLVRSFA